MSGGWVYIMANRYRGRMYTGVTSHLPARILALREGRGSIYVAEHALHRLVWAESAKSIENAIALEKRSKRWRREWKFALIERGNPNWEDLFEQLVG